MLMNHCYLCNKLYVPDKVFDHIFLGIFQLLNVSKVPIPHTTIISIVKIWLRKCYERKDVLTFVEGTILRNSQRKLSSVELVRNNFYSFYIKNKINSIFKKKINLRNILYKY